MARIEAQKGFIVETPYGYYHGVYEDPERGYRVRDTYKDYRFISCTGNINLARFFSSRQLAEECADGILGKAVPAVQATAVQITREDEKTVLPGRVINSMTEKEYQTIRDEIRSGKCIRFADDRDPMYDDSGYQPDPDFEED